MVVEMAKKVEFIKSISEFHQAPEHDFPEIAVIGRSNAGKSSFINHLLGRKAAFVSQTPGRTRVLNFFVVDDRYCLVDMPGYGFASRGQGEMTDWAGLIEDYLSDREVLKGVLLVMDMQRPWTAQEEQVKKFVMGSNLPIALVLTRADKLKPLELKKRIKELEQAAQVIAFPVSNTKKSGAKEVNSFFYNNWLKSQP